jgi:hypothetical protein
LRVASVTALTMTIAGTPGPLAVQAVARAVTLTRLKKVVTPAVPIYHSYTVEQNDEDIDEAELFLGTRLTGLSMSMRPNSMVTCAWTYQGLDRQTLLPAASPYFTSPNEQLEDSVVADDSWIRYKGADILSLTGFDLNLPMGAGLQPTIGSVVSPDVFMGDVAPAGTITAIRDSLQALRDFDAETEFEMQFLFTIPGLDPKACIGIYIPRAKIFDVDAPFLGGDAAKTETREIGIATHAGDTDNEAIAYAFFSSAP